MVSVYEGIGKDTTVAFSANAFTVSVIITGRRSDKGDIDYRFTGLDGTDTPPWERMMASPFNFPAEMASPIFPRTPED